MILDGGVLSGVRVGCCAQDVGQGVGDGLAVGLKGGDQPVQVHAFGLLGHADDLIDGARQVPAAGVPAELRGQHPAYDAEFVGHAGQLEEEGSGEPVGACRCRIRPGLFR